MWMSGTSAGMPVCTPARGLWLLILPVNVGDDIGLAAPARKSEKSKAMTGVVLRRHLRRCGDSEVFLNIRLPRPRGRLLGSLNHHAQVDGYLPIPTAAGHAVSIRDTTGTEHKRRLGCTQSESTARN
jgi:hypothetical protein